jgi:hypothetical protein
MANNKPNIRPKTVGFRCSKREVEVLETLASIWGRTLSETLREAVRETTERHGLAGFGPEKEKGGSNGNL